MHLKNFLVFGSVTVGILGLITTTNAEIQRTSSGSTNYGTGSGGNRTSAITDSYQNTNGIVSPTVSPVVNTYSVNTDSAPVYSTLSQFSTDSMTYYQTASLNGTSTSTDSTDFITTSSGLSTVNTFTSVSDYTTPSPLNTYSMSNVSVPISYTSSIDYNWTGTSQNFSFGTTQTIPYTDSVPVYSFPYPTLGITTDLPLTQLPSTDLPSTQLPSTYLPSTQLPSTDFPSTYLPSTQLTSTDFPSTQFTSTDLPSTQLTSTELPSTYLTSTYSPSIPTDYPVITSPATGTDVYTPQINGTTPFVTSPAPVTTPYTTGSSGVQQDKTYLSILIETVLKEITSGLRDLLKSNSARLNSPRLRTKEDIMLYLVNKLVNERKPTS